MTLAVLQAVVLLHAVKAGAGDALSAGQVGTVVHVHAPGVYEVECCDAAGRTIAMVTLGRGSLLPLVGMDPTEPRWLFKDFHALYQAAQRFVDEEPDARGNLDLGLLETLDMQLQRLKPAFALCEQVWRFPGYAVRDLGERPAPAKPADPDWQTCMGCGKQFPPDQLCTLGGGGPVCLPCAARITKEIDETTGPVPPVEPQPEEPKP